MTVSFTRPGKFLHLERSKSPVGDMHNTICKFLRAREIKKRQSSSLKSRTFSLRASSRTDRMIACFSSSGYSAGTAPLVKILLMSSRKLSLATWLSVNKNTTFSLSTPTLLNKRFKSSRKEFSSYPRVKVISKIEQPAAAAASFAKDCFPKPPSPIRSICPRSCLKTLWIRVACSSASWKKTRFIFLFALLSPQLSSAFWKVILISS